MQRYLVEESPFVYFFTMSSRSSPFWLILRLYIGWEWLSVGLEKIKSPEWVGSSAGNALSSFIQGALQKTSGANPDIQNWYALFLRSAVLPHLGLWSHLVAFGEVFVGIALILGLITGVAAFFGVFMNLNYLLAGSISTNPILLVLGILAILGWRVVGYIGIDGILLKSFRKRPVI